MKRVAGMGIADPLLRVLVWLTACGSVSLIGAYVGLIAMFVIVLAAAGAAAVEVFS